MRFPSTNYARSLSLIVPRRFCLSRRNLTDESKALALDSGPIFIIIAVLLKEQFDKGLLTSVSYCDRYLATPWGALLLREVLLRLAREGWADSRTALKLFTRELRRNLRPSRDGRSISDQWQDDAARQLFFEQAIGTGRGRLSWNGPFKFETGDAPHFRELRLEWGTGDTWTLKLDQGLGYWRCRPVCRLSFQTTAARPSAFPERNRQDS